MISHIIPPLLLGRAGGAHVWITPTRPGAGSNVDQISGGIAMNRLASIAAAAVAATGIALAPAPATAADGNDIAKIIAGIAVAGIIAKAIDDRKDRKRAESRATSNQFPRFGSIEDRDRRVIDGRIRPYDPYDYRHGPKDGRGYKKQALPEQCLLTVETARGDRLAYDARCLGHRFKYADRLPQVCETAVRTPRGFRTVFGARCLDREGWRVASR